MHFSYHSRVTSTLLLNSTLLHSHLCRLDWRSLDAVGCIKQNTITTITPAIDLYHLNTIDTIKMATSAAFALRKKFHPLPFPGAIIISSHFFRKVKYVLIIAIIIYHLL